MLTVINSVDHPLVDLLSSDPVRPEIPLLFRVSGYCESFALTVDSRIAALICCAYREIVPESVDQLLSDVVDNPSVAVFYTVWSLRAGSGRSIIFEVRDWIKSNRPNVQQFMTLSPLGQRVQQFHVGNGASIWRINRDTVNYQYL